MGRPRSRNLAMADAAPMTGSAPPLQRHIDHALTLWWRRLPCGGALTLCSPFRGGALTMRLPSCSTSVVCGWPSFAVSRLHLASSCPGFQRLKLCSGSCFSPSLQARCWRFTWRLVQCPQLAAIPSFVHSTARGRLPSRLRWLTWLLQPRNPPVYPHQCPMGQLSLRPCWPFACALTRLLQGIDFPRICIGFHSHATPFYAHQHPMGTKLPSHPHDRVGIHSRTPHCCSVATFLNHMKSAPLRCCLIKILYFS